MTIIGKRGQQTRITGYVTGPGGRIEMSAAHCTFAVGSIPMCKIFVPPEMLDLVPDEETDDTYEVIIQDEDGSPHTIFTGYFCGDTGSIDPKKIAAGFDLIHPARDLDNTRISAPSLHPSSIVDFSYVWQGSGTSAGAASSGNTFSKYPAFFEPGKGKVPEQMVKALMEHLKSISVTATSANGANVKTETMQKGIDLLGKLTFLDGKLDGKLEGPLSSEDDNSLNAWARSRAAGSFNSVRSVWDTLTAMFAELGIYLVCNNKGEIFTSVDCSGLSGGDNMLDGTYLTFYNKSTSMFRNVGEVQIASDNIRAETSGGSGQQGSVGSFVGYPKGGGRGSTLILQIPGWLNPIAETTGKLKDVQEAYAKMMYHIERNKFCTINVSGPLAPLVVPGTICSIKPYSAIKARSGGRLEDFGRTYTGYCHQVAHQVDTQGGTCQTTFSIKNVSVAGKGEEISKHPLFSDVKPFSWK